MKRLTHWLTDMQLISKEIIKLSDDIYAMAADQLCCSSSSSFTFSFALFSNSSLNSCFFTIFSRSSLFSSSTFFRAPSQLLLRFLFIRLIMLLLHLLFSILITSFSSSPSRFLAHSLIHLSLVFLVPSVSYYDEVRRWLSTTRKIDYDVICLTA